MQEKTQTSVPTSASNGGARNPGAKDVTWKALTDQALQRVQEYVQESLQSESAHTAALDASSGLLFKALFRLDAAIDEAMRHSADPFQRIDGIARAIDLLLRLTRQIDRLSHVRHLLEQARRALPEQESR